MKDSNFRSRLDGSGVVVDGSRFGSVDKKKTQKSFFRPTTMSLAMAEAGIIPGTHMVREMADKAVVRNRNDNRNIRPSIRLAF